MGQICEKLGEKGRAMHFYALAMDAPRPDPETRSRLAALAGGNDKIDAIIEKNHEELAAQRTIKLANAPKQEGKAEFILLLSDGHASEMSVDDVKFASGDEKLKAFTEALRAARYSQTVPDDTAVKVVRRGTLSCTATAADCILLLTLPSDVHSVD
jgi:hypothetical protein